MSTVKLTITKENITKTTLKDSSGHALYRIKTPITLITRRKTIIKKKDGDSILGLKVKVASIKWHRLRFNVVRVRGRDVPFDTSLWTHNRSFVASDGQSYKWHCQADGAKLYNTNTRLFTLNNPVVIYHPHQYRTLRKNKQGYLIISPSVVHILDDVVATFVYVEEMRRSVKKGKGAGVSPGVISNMSMLLSLAILPELDVRAYTALLWTRTEREERLK